MAEFKEVIKHWDRLGSKGCNNCPIEDLCDDLMEQTNGIRSICDCLIDYADKIEDGIMAWAAENPEPVYPTWLSVIVEHFKAGITDREVLAWLAENRIPADIAQKLGIEPKVVEK